MGQKNNVGLIWLILRWVKARWSGGQFQEHLHIIVYIGFVIINIELLEIVIDGLFGTHRIFSSLGSIYGFLIGAFEILAVLVLFSDYF